VGDVYQISVVEFGSFDLEVSLKMAPRYRKMYEVYNIMNFTFLSAFVS
jgi:hypothetical protein